MNVDKLLRVQRKFINQRDWEKFHKPKNLSIALNVESSELLEIFTWIDENDLESLKNKNKSEAINKEIADIFYYLLRLSDVLNIDLEKEFLKKMKENRKKYPVKKSKGSAKKYNEL